MTRPKSPSVLCSTTRLPTLIDSSAPCPSDPGPLPNGPEEGRPVPGGKDRPRANHGEGRDRRAPSTWEAVRLREANWYPTRNVGASEAIQISANRAECVCPWIDHIRDEKLPASSQRERDVADVDRDRHPFGCEAPIEKRHCQQFSRKVFELESYPRPKLFNRAASSSLTQATIFQNSTPLYIALGVDELVDISP
jgi:hypothetical protein